MGRWLGPGVLFVVLPAVLAACGGGKANVSSTDTKTTRAPVHRPSRYTLTIKASPAGSTGVRVEGRTNLPDGARVFLDAGQAFQYRTEHVARESTLATKTATVAHGRFSATLAPFNYRVLLAGLQPGGDPTFGPMNLVDNAVTVCASFETGYKDNPKTFEEDKRMPQQPDPTVREAVGPRGEYLKNSPQRIVFGSLLPHPDNWLEALARAPGAGSAPAKVQQAQSLAPTVKRLEGFCLN
jgi:hypothetical protein